MQIDEQTLSSVMDGEGTTGETLAGVAATNGTRAAWARYHLIGDVLRDNSSAVAPAEFAASISALIADEPTVLAPRQRTKSAMRPVAEFAIAASVATLAVIGIQRMEPDNVNSPAPTIAAAPAATPVPAGTDARDTSRATPIQQLPRQVQRTAFECWRPGSESLRAHRRL